MTTVDVQVALRAAGIRNPRLWALLALIAATVLGYLAFRGNDVLAHGEDAPAFHFLNGVRDWVDDNRDTSAVFLFFVNEIRFGISLFIEGIQATLSFLGGVGVVAMVGGLAALFARWRISALAIAGFTSLGMLGLWQESMDTLALTLAAVTLSLLVGIPLGIFAGCNRRARSLMTPVLDLM
ncbi:MAG: ABC transporter permease, partial [Longispora sp.]|nr:ABC transporter permease [Longispora sp. (in: high G+C Gram-positive bacteria)]